MTTNGKTNPQIQEAQRAVEQSERPLRELDAKITQMQVQVTKAQTEGDRLKTERDECEEALIDEKPGAAGKLRDIASRETESAARIRGLSAKLAALQRQRPQLEAEYQQASVRLAAAIGDAEFNHLEEELSHARYRLAQSQEETVQRQKIVNQLADHLHALAAQRRDAQWRATQQDMKERFRRANPNEPGFLRVRTGFSL
jgi:chromosome segregation ATPase